MMDVLSNIFIVRKDLGAQFRQKHRFNIFIVNDQLLTIAKK